MWNRVILAACGMAFGWGLANYWSAPDQEIPKHRYRLLVSLAIAMLLSIVLAWEQPASGLLAGGIFAFSAFVSYAANARQIDKEPSSPMEERLVAPSSEKEAPGVILVAHVEPPAYDGPVFWAKYLKHHALKGNRGPHWLAHPWVYHRVRAAYRRMEGEPPPAYRALKALEGALAQRLSQTLVQSVSVYGDDLVQVLRRMAQLGHKRFLLVPLDVTADLKQAVTRSRIREIGGEVMVLPLVETGVWSPERVAEDLKFLMRGVPPPDGRNVPEGVMNSLAEQIASALEKEA